MAHPPPRELFPSPARLSLTGQGPKCRGAGGGNTPGLNRNQIPRGENRHAARLCAGALPLTLRVQGHRLPGHHLQTPTVSVPWHPARPHLSRGCGCWPLTCPSPWGHLLCLQRAPEAGAVLLCCPVQGEGWQLGPQSRCSPREGEELPEDLQGRAWRHSLCFLSKPPHPQGQC